MPGLLNPVVDADGGLAFDFLGLFSRQLVLLPLERHTIVFGLPAAVPYRIDPSVPKQAARCKRRLSFTDMPLIGSARPHSAGCDKGLAHMPQLGFRPKSRNFKPFEPPEKIKSLRRTPDAAIASPPRSLSCAEP